MSAPRGDKAHPPRLLQQEQAGAVKTPHTVTGRRDKADAGFPLLSLGSSSDKLIQVLQDLPSPSLQRRALGWHRGMCYSCSCTATSLSPAQFHVQPQCHRPPAPPLTSQSHPTRAVSSPQLQQQTRSHSHAAAGPWGCTRGALGQAAPPGTAGEAGLRQAEDGSDRDGEGWEGALVFCGQNTLVPLQHHP